MPELVRVGIAGLGHYLPETRLTNKDLETLVDTSDDWIVQRTGIKERRRVAPGQNCSDLGIEAAKMALEDAKVRAEDVDLIIFCTVSADHLMPATACLVQTKLGCRNAGAFDLEAACTGFTKGLVMGAQCVRTGLCKNVLVIGAEALTRFVDYRDRTSCIIFGDGAGAALLRPLEDCGGQGEVLDCSMGSDGDGYEFIHRRSGGTADPVLGPENLEGRDLYMRVKGRDVYRFAVATMSKLIRESIEPHGMDALGLIIPHQVNARIISSALEKIEIPEEKCFLNIEKYGNTSAASVPIALSEAYRANLLEKGKIQVLVAFGAGLTWARATVRW